MHHLSLKKYIVFIFILSLLTCATFLQSLSFTFWKDDWGLYWGSLYQLQSLFVYVLHPGAFLEFYLFSHLFSFQPWIWQMYGILLRITMSGIFALVIQNLTKSVRAGIIAGIFLAVSYYGLESIVFASAHIVALSLIFFLLTIYYFVRWEEKKTSFLPWLLFFLVALLLDPVRMIFGSCLVIYLHFGIYKHKLQKKLLFIASTVLLLFLSFFFLAKGPVGDTVVVKGFVKALHNPSLFEKKIYIINTYFASIGNMYTGLFFPMKQDVQNTGEYSRIYSLIGFILFLFTVGFGYVKKIKRSTQILVLLFLWWPFIFYFPNWLFEPRAPMTGAHRYLMASSLGFLGLLAYLVSKIKNTVIAVCLIILFVSLSVIQVHRILSLEATFRSEKLVNYFWNTIHKETSPENKKYYFIISGDQPLLSQAILLSWGMPFAVQRHISRSENIPFVGNFFELGEAICLQKKEAAQVDPSLRNVYAWVIKNPEGIINVTDKTRSELQKYITTPGCQNSRMLK